MKRHWTTDELIDEWTLHPEDLDLLSTKTGPGRLGFAVLLMYFRHEGRFPRQKQEVPGAVVAYLAKQVAASPEDFLRYPWSGRTIEAHRAQIRKVDGFHVTSVADATQLAAWLCERVLASEHREEGLVEALLGECRARQLEPPSPDRLARLVRTAVHTFEQALYARTVGRLSPSAREALEALIAPPPAGSGLEGEGDGEDDDPGGDPDALDDLGDRDLGDRAADPADRRGSVVGGVAGVGGGSTATDADRDEADGDATGDAAETGWDVEALLDRVESADSDHVELDEHEERVAVTSSASRGHVPSGTGRSVSISSISSISSIPGVKVIQGVKGIKAPEELSLQDLRADPGPTGLESVLQEVNKLVRLRQNGLPADLFAELSPRVLQVYRDRAAVEAPSLLRAHPEPIRLTLLAALCWSRAQEVTDGLVTLLIAVVQRMARQAERRVDREVLAEYRKVAGKTGILFRVAEAAVTHPDSVVREVIYPAAGGERTLADLVKEYKSSGPRYREHVYLVMKKSFSTYYRRMLPHLLDVLDFRSNNELHQPLIRALALIRAYAHGGPAYYPADEPVPIEGIVRPMWRDLVVEDGPEGMPRVVRLHYELCALQTLRDALRVKEVWVVGARRFRNPDEDLPADFEVKRDTYYAALKQPTDAAAFVAAVRTEQEAALGRLDVAVARGRARGVKILAQRGGRIQVARFTPLPDPPILARLKGEITARWPMTGLLDILKETALRTGFSARFTSVAGREALDPETLQKRLLLCLFGLGTNTGLKRLAGADPGSTYSDLRYVRRRYVAREQVRAAIADVANAVFRVRRAELWGEATTACASDPKKFGAWDQNLMTEWSARHFGRGVMVYWHLRHEVVYVAVETGRARTQPGVLPLDPTRTCGESNLAV
jgi:Tn3 transposase DDE domain/Domain of unknown function (DUF4158)